MSTKTEIRRVFFNRVEKTIEYLKKEKDKEIFIYEKTHLIGYIEGVYFSEIINDLEYTTLYSMTNGIKF